MRSSLEGTLEQGGLDGFEQETLDVQTVLEESEGQLTLLRVRQLPAALLAECLVL
jgi:hypothetical protein